MSTSPLSPDPALRAAIIAELAEAPEGLSLAKLCKRLGVRRSVLLRTLAWLGDAPIGTQRGEGLVRLHEHGDLTIAVLNSDVAAKG